MLDHCDDSIIYIKQLVKCLAHRKHFIITIINSNGKTGELGSSFDFAIFRELQ